MNVTLNTGCRGNNLLFCTRSGEPSWLVSGKLTVEGTLASARYFRNMSGALWAVEPELMVSLLMMDEVVVPHQRSEDLPRRHGPLIARFQMKKGPLLHLALLHLAHALPRLAHPILHQVTIPPQLIHPSRHLLELPLAVAVAALGQFKKGWCQFEHQIDSVQAQVGSHRRQQSVSHLARLEYPNPQLHASFQYPRHPVPWPGVAHLPPQFKTTAGPATVVAVASLFH